MIRLENVNKSYWMGGKPLHVLQDVDLEIAQGELVAVVGSSGSGKSTLLNVLGLLDEYDSGSYYLNEELMRDLGQRRAAAVRNRTIGFVFQSFNLLPFKTAEENVALPLYYQGIARRKRNRIARDYLEQVGLLEWAAHRPTELSGGQQQRVAIARAMVTRPQVVLADEPTGALDSKTSLQIMDMFEAINSQGITIVLVTHERDIAARVQRLIRLRDGAVVD